MITRRISLRQIPDDSAVHTVTATFVYSPLRPLEVRLSLPGSVGLARTDWVFARDLLLSGVRGPTGVGAVSIWPGPGESGTHLYIALSDRDDCALFRTDRDELTVWLLRTLALVPRDQEACHLGVDELIDRLLAR
ncbi:SsgA family sporulation/cell division regulator [Streptomyces sp. IBSNAI002]|uniref:SsgA family sporulation/cell division regulator n=1 Tax=Streptomyces sp. IBSNAI002 TaxID=3457500 RepID=UPI003FD38760